MSAILEAIGISCPILKMCNIDIRKLNNKSGNFYWLMRWKLSKKSFPRNRKVFIWPKCPCEVITKGNGKRLAVICPLSLNNINKVMETRRNYIMLVGLADIKEKIWLTGSINHNHWVKHWYDVEEIVIYYHGSSTNLFYKLNLEDKRRLWIIIHNFSLSGQTVRWGRLVPVCAIQ